MVYWIVRTIRDRETKAIGNYKQGIGIRGAAWRLGIPVEPIHYFEQASGYFFVHIDSVEQLKTLIRNSPEAMRSGARVLESKVWIKRDTKGRISEVYDRVPKGVAKADLEERILSREPLSDYEMYRLFKAYADLTREKPPEPLKVGDMIEVIMGPFKDLRGTITEVGEDFVEVQFLEPWVYARFPVKMALESVQRVE